MKDKTVAGILALLLGWIGVHRFYLGQPGLGILYIILMFTGVSFLLSLIDAIIFFTTDEEVFDAKYNRKYIEKIQYTYRPRNRNRERQRYQQKQFEQRKRTQKPTQNRRKSNPFREAGLRKYKDYDFEGAIEDFKKSLRVDPRDKRVHFRLACLYSLTEQVSEGFFHLDKAVQLGFVNFERIQNEGDLAFIRTQPQFETFVKNGYRLVHELKAPEEEPLDDIIKQIERLGDLKQKGLLTEEEFAAQKAKLLNKQWCNVAMV